jgi:hypothetical protein
MNLKKLTKIYDYVMMMIYHIMIYGWFEDIVDFNIGSLYIYI